MNPNLEYHNESTVAQLFATLASTESKEYSFPIIDTAVQPRKKAEILLLKEHAESKAFEFYGMPTLARYSVGDVLMIPLNGVEYMIRIEKKHMELPIGKVRFQAVLTSAAAYAVTVGTVTAPPPNLARNVSVELKAQVMYPRNTVVFVIPSMALTEKDEGRLGVYLAISGRGRGKGENSALYREMDTDNFVLHSIVDSPTPMGLCVNTLATHTPTTSEDTVNFLDIHFFDDIQIESVLQADIDRYPRLNLIRVGNEWIQFRTATAQTLDVKSPYRSKWRITNLWRGRFNTSAAVGSHAANEYAAVVTPALRFFDLETEDIGKTISLKAVTGGQAIENAPKTSFVFLPATGGAAFKALFDRYTDATTTGLTVEPLYTNVIPAGTLTNVGDKILFKYAGKYAANINSKRIFVQFAGVNIADSKTQPADAVKWQIDGSIMKIDADSVRYESEWSAGDIAPVVGEGQIDALDLALDDFELKLSATTPTAAGDATVTIGYAYFVPPATAEPAYLTFLNDTLTFDGSALTFTPSTVEPATLAFLGDTLTFDGVNLEFTP